MKKKRDNTSIGKVNRFFQGQEEETLYQSNHQHSSLSAKKKGDDAFPYGLHGHRLAAGTAGLFLTGGKEKGERQLDKPDGRPKDHSEKRELS